jgi:hypothetical protein
MTNSKVKKIIVKMKPKIAINKTSFGGNKYAKKVNKTL